MRSIDVRSCVDLVLESKTVGQLVRLLLPQNNGRLLLILLVAYLRLERDSAASGQSGHEGHFRQPQIRLRVNVVLIFELLGRLQRNLSNPVLVFAERKIKVVQAHHRGLFQLFRIERADVNPFARNFKRLHERGCKQLRGRSHQLR